MNRGCISWQTDTCSMHLLRERAHESRGLMNSMKERMGTAKKNRASTF